MGQTPLELLDTAIEAIERDMRLIVAEGKKGKLSSQSARNLIQYAKTLSEITKLHQKTESDALSEPLDETDLELLKELERDPNVISIIKKGEG